MQYVAEILYGGEPVSYLYDVPNAIVVIKDTTKANVRYEMLSGGCLLEGIIGVGLDSQHKLCIRAFSDMDLKFLSCIEEVRKVPRELVKYDARYTVSGSRRQCSNRNDRVFVSTGAYVVEPCRGSTFCSKLSYSGINSTRVDSALSLLLRYNQLCKINTLAFRIVQFSADVVGNCCTVELRQTEDAQRFYTKLLFYEGRLI